MHINSSILAKKTPSSFCTPPSFLFYHNYVHVPCHIECRSASSFWGYSECTRKRGYNTYRGWTQTGYL